MWNSNYWLWNDWDKYQLSWGNIWCSNAVGVSWVIISINKKLYNCLSCNVVLRCRSWHLNCLLLVFIRQRSQLLMGYHLYHGILMWWVDFDPHCSDDCWFSELLLKQRACDAVQVHSTFALCKRCIRASLPLPTMTRLPHSLKVQHDTEITFSRIFPSLFFCISAIISCILFRSVSN